MGSYHDRYGNSQQRAGARFTIGRDHHGWWVVHDRLDRVGGYFVSEDAARHFAVGEAGHDATQVCTVTAVEEVDLFPGLAGSRSIGQRILENNRRIRSHGAAR
jgi:hypothetical protein